MIVYIALFWLLLILLFAASWAWGSWVERRAASMFLLAAIATFVLRPVWTGRWIQIEAAILIIDLALVIGLISLSVRSQRWWVTCAAALQIISTLAHLARAMDPYMWRFAYQIMEESSSYPTLVLLAIGIWQARRQPTSATVKR